MLKHYLELPRAVHILCMGTLINRAGTLLLPFLTLYLTSELGFGVRFAGLGMGAVGTGSIIGALVGGHLADRLGRRWVMLVSLCGSAAVLMLFGQLRSPYAIIIALVLFAALADMYRPAAAAMIGDLVPSEQRPYAFGLVYFAINLGFPVGTVVGGALAAYWFQGLFWVDAVTALIYAGIIACCISETLPSRPEPGRTTPTEDPTDSKTLPGPRAANHGNAMRQILHDAPFLIFCVGSLLIGLTYVQSFSTLPVYMQSQGVGVKLYGRLLAINGFMIVLIQIPLTAWMKQYNRVTFVCLAAAITGVGFGATAWATSVPFFALTIVIWTLGEIMAAPFTHSIVADLAPVAYRARYMGVFTMCFASANMLGAPLGGLILDTAGKNVLWGGTMLLCFTAAALYVSIHRQISTRSSVA